MAARWPRGGGAWTRALEVAPGIQKIADVSAGAALRLNGGIRYAVAPGREVGLTGGFSTLGPSLFAEGTTGYRYRFLAVSGSSGF